MKQTTGQTIYYIVDLTFKNWTDVPGSYSSVRGILSQRNLQHKHGDCPNKNTDEIGNQESSCKIKQAVSFAKLYWVKQDKKRWAKLIFQISLSLCLSISLCLCLSHSLCLSVSPPNQLVLWLIQRRIGDKEKGRGRVGRGGRQWSPTVTFYAYILAC